MKTKLFMLFAVVCTVFFVNCDTASDDSKDKALLMMLLTMPNNTMSFDVGGQRVSMTSGTGFAQVATVYMDLYTLGNDAVSISVPTSVSQGATYDGASVGFMFMYSRGAVIYTAAGGTLSFNVTAVGGGRITATFSGTLTGGGGLTLSNGTLSAAIPK